MRRFLETLDENQPGRSAEEYLGAFMESLKMVSKQSPIDRMGNAIMLAAKTALRLKAVMPKVKEYEIAGRLKSIARNIRLMDILSDLTPEEKNMLKLNPVGTPAAPAAKTRNKIPATRSKRSKRRG